MNMSKGLAFGHVIKWLMVIIAILMSYNKELDFTPLLVLFFIAPLTFEVVSIMTLFVSSMELD